MLCRKAWVDGPGGRWPDGVVYCLMVPPSPWVMLMSMEWKMAAAPSSGPHFRQRKEEEGVCVQRRPEDPEAVPS